MLLPGNCIIDCEEEGRGFLFSGDQAGEDVIDGIMVINGWVRTESPVLADGGAIPCNGTSPRIINCILQNNVTGDKINSLSQSYYADGGATDCINGSSPYIFNNLIENNYANHTGKSGIRIRGKPYWVIAINIIRGNQADVGLENIDFQYPEDVPDIRNSDIEEGIGDILTDYGETIIDQDPLFTAPAAGDFHLLSDSPAIDTGNLLAIKPFDYAALGGDNRVSGSTVDMGAYEYQLTK